MRPFVIPFIVWLAALQVYSPLGRLGSIAAVGELVSGAAALAGLTVAVYRLGVWRQEMRHTKDTVVAGDRAREPTSGRVHICYCIGVQIANSNPSILLLTRPSPWPFRAGPSVIGASADRMS